MSTFDAFSTLKRILLYASSAWWGFTTAGDRHRIKSCRGVRACLYPADGRAAAQLIEEDYNDTLFSHLLSFEQHNGWSQIKSKKKQKNEVKIILVRTSGQERNQTCSTLM